ncbi:hypothetical protein ABZ705_19215 [Streptomyces sp. NPDC006984]|uniref:hypothetical protein n=1 Tax=Streptomyces sp. NPDC006984 TaxID=3155463 RepID=UPI00340E2F26
MATQAAMPSGRHRRTAPDDGQHHSPLGFVLPAVLAVTAGLWAASILRFQDGGIANGAQWLVGIICALVLGMLAFALGRWGHALPRELRALAYGGLFGATVGFLTSLAGGSVLRASGIGLACGAGLTVVMFYSFYVRE